MRFSLVLGLSLATTILSACGPGSDTGSAPTAPEVATAPAVAPSPESAAATPAPTTGIWLDPAALSACARPVKVSVHWDASSFAGVKTVDIIVVNKAGKEALFLSAGRAGSRDTGEWMRAGSKVILRNHGDSAELANATVDSIPCNKK